MSNGSSGKKRKIEPQNVRRQQLIDATIQSIARFGLSGTTSARVTTIARLSVGMINLHFASKDDLLEAALLHLVAEHHDLWREGLAARGLTNAERLLAIVDSHFAPEICSHTRLSTWYAFFGESGYRDMYVSIATEADNDRKQAVTDICKAIVDEGEYPNVDCSQTAMLLETLFDGHWLNMLVYPDEFSATRSKNQIRGFLASSFPRHFNARQAERPSEKIPSSSD